MNRQILLSGVVGSQAYGLATEDSDWDMLGVYAAPTEDFLGLRPPDGQSATVHHTNPDETYHEALKFVRLCIQGNPTVMELLWLPDGMYRVRTHLGLDLIEIREHFLSAPRVRDAYLGYAVGQFKKLKERGDGTFASDLRKRTEKHARHLLRLLHQGVDLYETGQLTVRLADPKQYVDFGKAVAADPVHAEEALETARRAFEGISSPLPKTLDLEPIEQWLFKVRRAYLDPDWMEGKSS